MPLLHISQVLSEVWTSFPLNLTPGEYTGGSAPKETQMLVSYPKTLSNEALLGLVAIVRGGQLFSRTAELHSYLWNMQGYFAGTLLGDPTDEALVAAGPEPDEGLVTDCLAAIQAAEEELCRHAVRCNRYTVGGDQPTVGVIDPATITLILTLIQTLGPMILEWLRNRRKQPVLSIR